ncbi:hypothetical protein DKX38_025517 [Salix brachista]|uniref:Pentacotripeptide-repeat region of PRORP domain-containing protein n=1 Tax=Salix brachista TaxID=2182728 RepID=A0A5N5JP83_9ROSI|nr:hypothetical protein DKX38_025517 [Salix brachista]
MWRSIAAKSRVVARNFCAIKTPNNRNKVYPSQSHISIWVSSQSSQNLRFLSYFSTNPNENDHSQSSSDDSSMISGEHNDNQFEGLSEQTSLPFSENGDAQMETFTSGDVNADSFVGEENVESEAYEIDVEKLDNVLSLLQSIVDESLESTLDSFSLVLHEEFVVKVLQTPLVLGENLIRFFKWAMKKQDLSVTTRVIDVLVSSICSRDLRRKNAYALWDLVREIGEKNEGLVSVGSLNQLIALLSKLGKGKAVLEVFHKSKDFGCVPDSETYYYTIEALCRRSFYDWAWIVCEKMLDQGPLPDSEKIGKIICWLCKGSKAKDAHTVYLLAKENNKCPPKPALYFLIGSLCRDDGTVKLALEMLNDFEGEAQKYAIKPFSSVIRGLCRIKDLDGAKQLLLKMIAEGPPPGNAVFNTIISGYCKGGDMKEAVEIMKLLESRGLKPDVYTYTVIISGYSNGGQMEEACYILSEAKKKHSKLSPVTYHALIRGYCKLEQFDKALELLAEMEKFGVQPNVDEYNKLIQSLCLKSLDWETAEKLFAEMKEKGLYLNSITRSLITAVKELEEEGLAKEVSIEA